GGSRSKTSKRQQRECLTLNDGQKPLDYCTSLDKDITQIKMRRKRSRRQPLKDITNLFVSSPPLSSSFMVRHLANSIS
ncbi:unnamed protein product, partial [Brassica napus]